MRTPYYLLCLLLVFGLSPALAQDMTATRNVVMLDDSKAALTSDKKDKLAMSVTGRAFQGSVFLRPGTPVKVVSRQAFTTRESVGATAKQVNRSFTVALVEVQDGDHKGIKGWVVIDVQDAGQRKDVYFSPGKAAASGGGSASGADLNSSVDLAVSVGVGHISPTGGRLYEVGVVNKGGLVCKDGFEVVVEIDGKVVETKRFRGPLNPNEVVSFTLPVGDRELRNRATIRATVDPKNTVEDANKANNTATIKAAP